jgi:hypothetical protein
MAYGLPTISSLAPIGQAVRWSLSLFKAGGYTASFNAPSAGVLSILWMTASAQASRANHKPEPVVMASGTKSFGAAGPYVFCEYLVAPLNEPSTVAARGTRSS